jgi:ABA DEFICIENT 4-like
MYFLLFNVAAVAMIGWALMILFPTWRATRWIASRAVFPVYLAALYVVGVVALLAAAGPGIMREFASANGVVLLLSNPSVALVAWIHILTFDQLAGILIYRHNMRMNVVPLPVQSAILILTLMFGPAGFLVYYGTSAARNRGMLTGEGA